MQAVHLTAYGDPVLNLSLVEIAEPAPPGKGEVLLQVEFSPINASDLLLAKGMYMVRPELPSVIGNEGTGTVQQVGEGVNNVAIGDRVLIPRGIFAWVERVVVRAEELLVVPPKIDPRQASMLSINPPTAALLLSEYGDLKPGDWIVQNAGNSGVARSVIEVAKLRGLRTISIVRRQELIGELRDAGADVVLLHDEHLAQGVKEAIGDGQVRLGLEAVGGGSAATILSLLSPGATMVVFASMSGEPLLIDAFALVAKRITVSGFFMYYPEFLPKLGAAIAEGARLAAAGCLQLPVERIYPLREIKNAVSHAIRGGKILLDLRVAT